MMNEINNLIWPSPNGIGILDPAAWAQTVETAIAGEILAAEPPDEAFRTDLAEAARAGLDGRDRDRLRKPAVEVTPGGE